MKKTLLIFFVAIMSIQLTAQELNPDSIVPIFEFEQEVIDYGDIAYNSEWR